MGCNIDTITTMLRQENLKDKWAEQLAAGGISDAMSNAFDQQLKSNRKSYRTGRGMSGFVLDGASNS